MCESERGRASKEIGKVCECEEKVFEMVDMNLSKSQKKNLGYLERGWPPYLYSRKAIPVANKKQGPFCES